MTIRVQCAWCRRVIRPGNSDRVSHGICAKCGTRLRGRRVTARTYNELFEPTLRLTLEHEGSGNYIVVHDDTPGSLASGNATVYMRSPDLDLCARFMLAMQAKRQAVIDEDSIVWFRLLKTSGFSVRVPAVEEVEPGLPRGTDGGSTSSNVVPIRKAAG